MLSSLSTNVFGVLTASLPAKWHSVLLAGKFPLDKSLGVQIF
jgi:hypothetical protein